MEPSVSPGLIKSAYNWLNKKIFQRHYNFAHSAFLTRNSIGSHWQTLDGNIEVSLQLATIFSNDPQKNSKIAFRTNDSESIEYLEVLLEASNSVQRYQDVIKVFNINKTPTYFNIQNFPIKRIYVSEEGGIFSSYDTISPTILKKKMKNNIEDKPKTLMPWSLMHNEYFNSDFTLKWGDYYNIDIYTEAKNQLKQHIVFSLCGSWGMLEYSHPKANISKIKKIKHAIVSVLINDKFIETLFWSTLLLKLISVDKDGHIKSNIKGFNAEKLSRIFGTN